MDRTAIFAAVLLLGSAFAFAGAASAEEIDRCESEAGLVTACVEDSTSGDRDEACSADGDGTYRGETGAGVFVGGFSAPKAGASVEGQERCYHSPELNHREDISTNVRACVFQAGFFGCDIGANTAQSWDENDVSTSTTLDAFTSVSASAAWGNTYGGDCQTEVSASHVDSVDAGCPAGAPPGAPNPGWGQVTPDVPEMLREHLPSDV